MCDRNPYLVANEAGATLQQSAHQLVRIPRDGVGALNTGQLVTVLRTQ